VPDLDDAELVRRTRSGDRNAYGELVSRYQGHVYGLAYSLVGNWIEAQDIAQETFIRGYTNLDQLRDPARFAAWLRRVAFGVAMNWLKAFRPKLFQKIDGRVDLDRLDIPDFRPGPSEVAQNRELANAVIQAVDSLPPKYRVPLTMFHLDGLSYKKVADFLGIPLGTAQALIHRARAKLKAALSAYSAGDISPMVQEVFNEHKLGEEFARRIIEGLENVRWGGGQMENSVLGALSAAMRAIGEDVSYEYLMGVSGAAFRLQIHASGGCNAPAPHAGIGYNCVRPALEAMGYETVGHDTHDPGIQGRWSWADEDDREEIHRVRDAILESIDDGVPVLYGSEEESLIVGYRNGGKELLLRPYMARKDGYSPMRRWPWSVGILKKRREAPDRRETIIHSFEVAVMLANAERFGEYASGFEAYKVWIADLLDAPRYENQDAHDAAGLMIGNSHCYYSLVDARASAAIYLRSIADEFGKHISTHLLKAADLYQQIFETLTRRCPTQIAPNPWMLEKGKSWTQEMRAFQTDILKEALPLERKAVAEIKKALRLIKG